MRIRAVLPSVKEFEVNVPDSMTVEDLKAVISKKLGIEPKFTRLILGNRSLDPRLKLKRLNRPEKIIVDHLWARHMILWGGEGQRRIREANVLLVGAGAIGNEVAKNLAMLGIGRIGIVDSDIIELSNTSRMVFFDRNSVGRPKADALADAIKRKYPHTCTDAYQSKLENIPLATYLNADVIACGLDNALSRIFLSTVGSKYGIPIVDGGMLGYQARVQTYVPSKSPCLACIFPRAQYGQITSLKNPCDPSVEEAKIPSLPTTTSLVSAVQTHELLKLIVGYDKFLKDGTWPQETGAPTSGVWIADLRYGKHLTMPLERNEKCVVCGKDGVGRESVRRVEIPLGTFRRSRSFLRKEILKFIPQRAEDLEISRIKMERSKTRVERKGLPRRVRQGDFLQVTFKSTSDTYGEMIVRLV
jgi:molybdopterin/thiamine biosynthesis adenylyltransferase